MATPPTVPKVGFCIYLNRIRQEKRNGFSFARTISEYQCYWNGEPIAGMNGQMAERNGPGDNTAIGVSKHRRIEAKKYPLSVHKGNHYETYDYEKDHLLPSLLVKKTGARSGILIHPCHDDDGYLSSIGCINPAVGLIDANSRVNLKDSKARVVAIIEEMKAKLKKDFPKEGTISNAVLVIDGEPK